MKSFNTVYNNSKKEVLTEKAKLFESQKKAVINMLKETYMITCDIKTLPMERQRELAKKVLEYWSPKTGLNAAGQKLLLENEIVLTPRSNKEDIRMYIEKQVKKHLVAITEAYRNSKVDVVIETFKEDIEPRINKQLKESYISNIVWNLVSDRIKTGIV